jgi:hypothetical protein
MTKNRGDHHPPVISSTKCSDKFFEKEISGYLRGNQSKRTLSFFLWQSRFCCNMPSSQSSADAAEVRAGMRLLLLCHPPTPPPTTFSLSITTHASYHFRSQFAFRFLCSPAPGSLSFSRCS